MIRSLRSSSFLYLLPLFVAFGCFFFRSLSEHRCERVSEKEGDGEKKVGIWDKWFIGIIRVKCLLSSREYNLEIMVR